MEQVIATMEERLPVSISKAGAVRDCYLMLGGNKNFKRVVSKGRAVQKKPSQPREPGPVITVTSAYLKDRFGVDS